MTAHRRPRRRPSVQALRRKADETRHRLEAQRPTNRVVDAVFQSVQLHSEAGGGLLAGAIAFRFFLFLVPGTFVVVMGLGLGADATGTDVRDVARQLGIAGLAATAMQSGADATTVTRWITFGVALVAMVAGARNLLKALLVAHALIWRVPLRGPRRSTLAGLGLLGITLVATVLLLLSYRIRSVSLIGAVVGLALYTLVPAGLWLVFSLRLFPARPGVTWRDLWPGAALFGVGMEGLHLVTVLWVARSMESKSEAYGTLGAALTILFWAYLLGRLVTSAAALNAALWRTSHPEGVGSSPAPHDAALRSQVADSEPGAR